MNEEQKPRAFENRIMRNIMAPRRNEVIRDWRILHNGKLCDLYSSPNTVRVTKSRRMGGACSTYREEEEHTQSFSGET
jgi:hypothetical protein